MNNAKIAFVDIETAPTLAWVWRRFQENIGLDQVESDGYILCGAWKWKGEKEAHVVGNTDFKSCLLEDDSQTVFALWKVLDEADIVVAHYGKRFDVPFLNARFVKHSLRPPSPYKVVDTKEVAKKKFMFPSNKLDGLLRFFNLPQKHETDFNLWKGCLHGDKGCWDRMLSYCANDVIQLEKVYDLLLPWMDQHPNVAMYSDMVRPACPKCGSTRIQWRGLKTTWCARYRAFQCQSCGGWGRSRVCDIPNADRKNVVTHSGD